MQLSSYEQERLRHIQEWEKAYINRKGNNVLRKLGDVVARPFQKATENEVYSKVKRAIETAVLGLLSAQQDTASRLYDPRFALKQLQKKHSIEEMDEFWKVDVRDLNHIVQKANFENRLIAGLEGTLTGLGGLEAALADIPILLSLIFRTMQQIAACYGYDPVDEKEKLYMLNLIAFSSALGQAGKLEVQAQLIALRVAIKRYTFKAMQEMGGKFSMIIVARQIAKDLGYKLTKDTLLKGIPLLGASFGGFFNYGFITKVCTVTSVMYEKRFLEDKQERREIA